MPTLVVDRVRTIPSTPTVTWWSKYLPPWETPVTGRMVDTERTRQLSPFDDRVRLYPGVPLQLAATTTTRTLNREQPGTLFNPFPTVQMPFPAQTWVDQWTTDFMWFGVDPGRQLYWEATEVGPFSLFKWLPTDLWALGYVRVYDLNARWDAQRPSVTGGGLPMWPLVPRMADLDGGAGGVRHALHFVVSNGYSNEPPIPPARKTDGLVKGHPLRAGARLRLTPEAFDRLTAQAETAHDAAILWALHIYGAIVNDRTMNGHACRLPADPRLTVTVSPRLTDFEVLI